MAELKTKKNDASVLDFLNAVENEQRRTDALRVDAIMRELTGEEPKMWGTSIVGYGDYHYTYASGREGDWMQVGFSPRKASLSLYIMSGFKGHDDILSRLGKFKTGKGCLYVNKLADVDESVLRELITASLKTVRSR